MHTSLFQAALPLALAPTQWELLRKVLLAVSVRKGEPVLRPGQVCNQIYFVGHGLLRHYLLHEGKEINTHFALPGSFTSDFSSLTGQQPATVAIEALATTELLVLRRSDLLALYTQAPDVQAVGRGLLENLLAQQQLRLEMLLRDSAQARYRYLQQHQPELLQEVSLQHLASYLGLSRETLSRVRGR